MVGGTTSAATPANATKPMRVPCGCASMKLVAAFSAAVIRFGVTSVEHIDPETSSARMIVVELDDTASVVCGRAAPIASTRQARAEAGPPEHDDATVFGRAEHRAPEQPTSPARPRDVVVAVTTKQ